MSDSMRGRGGDREASRYAVAASSLGAVAIAATKAGVCAVAMADGAEEAVRWLRAQFPRAVEDASAIAVAVRSVLARIEGAEDGPGPALDLRGTAFQRRVWEALRAIPPGKTASYGEVAERIGHPAAVRAVAGACAANRVAVLVPCHRVVRRDGALGGYRWGLARKRTLLDREALWAPQAERPCG